MREAHELMVLSEHPTSSLPHCCRSKVNRLPSVPAFESIVGSVVLSQLLFASFLLVCCQFRLLSGSLSVPQILSEIVSSHRYGSRHSLSCQEQAIWPSDLEGRAVSVQFHTSPPVLRVARQRRSHEIRLLRFRPNPFHSHSQPVTMNKLAKAREVQI
jgi:hypothetical protein